MLTLFLFTLTHIQVMEGKRYSISPLLLAAVAGYCPLRTITVGGGATVQYPYSFDNDAIVRELIKHGADVNKKGQYKGPEKDDWDSKRRSLYPMSDDITPLQAAMSRGFSKVVLCLLKSGADVSRALLSPHGYAIRHSSVVELVLKHGADVNASGTVTEWCDKKLRTPLLSAIKCPCGSLGIVELLLKRGAQVVNNIPVIASFPYFLCIFLLLNTCRRC